MVHGARQPLDPDSGWTSDELQSEDLGGILRRDFRVEPEGTSTSALRQQILNEQARDVVRGELRWCSADGDEDFVTLYEPSAAREACELLDILKGIATWADVRALRDHRTPVTEKALEIVWESWELYHPDEDGWTEGLPISARQLDSILSIDDLFDIVPPDTELSFENLIDGNDFVYVSPVDPWQMGVPLLVINRYCRLRGGMVSSWTDTPADALPQVERTLRAIGWTLTEGNGRDDLHSFYDY